MQLENVEDVYSLSPIQEGMLFHSIAEPGSGVFIEQICCTVRGDLNIDQFQQAWTKVVARHAALRTMFLWDGLDEPLQVVREQVDVPWKSLDWREQEVDQQRLRLAEYLRADRHDGFDLSQAPLTRMTLIRTRMDS